MIQDVAVTEMFVRDGGLTMEADKGSIPEAGVTQANPAVFQLLLPADECISLINF